MLYKAIKAIIITEKLISKGVCDIIDASGATGYTIIPVGGKGRHTHASASNATVVDDFTHVKIEVIVREKALAQEITDNIIEKYFHDYSGISYLEEVQIHRPEKFILE